jgi:hypothetical protein
VEDGFRKSASSPDTIGRLFLSWLTARTNAVFE